MRILWFLIFPFMIFAQNNYSIVFDGTGDYLKETVANYRSGDSQGSISYWMKPTTITGDNRCVFVSSDEAGTNNWLRSMIFDTGDLAEIGNRDGAAANLVTGSTTITIDSWWNFIIVSNGTAYSLYVNGNDETENARAGSDDGGWFADVSARDNVTIGGHEHTSVLDLFIGNIDEVRVFTSALDAGQVASIYNNGTPNGSFDYSSVGQVMYLNFEEGTGTSTSDQTGSLVFDFQGDPQWSTDTPGWEGGDNPGEFKSFSGFPAFKGGD